jgi:hypothetical protein
MDDHLSFPPPPLPSGQPPSGPGSQHPLIRDNERAGPVAAQNFGILAANPQISGGGTSHRPQSLLEQAALRFTLLEPGKSPSRELSAFTHAFMNGLHTFTPQHLVAKGEILPQGQFLDTMLRAREDAIQSGKPNWSGKTFYDAMIIVRDGLNSTPPKGIDQIVADLERISNETIVIKGTPTKIYSEACTLALTALRACSEDQRAATAAQGILHPQPSVAGGGAVSGAQAAAAPTPPTLSPERKEAVLREFMRTASFSDSPFAVGPGLSTYTAHVALSETSAVNTPVKCIQFNGVKYLFQTGYESAIEEFCRRGQEVPDRRGVMLPSKTLDEMPEQAYLDMESFTRTAKATSEITSPELIQARDQLLRAGLHGKLSPIATAEFYTGRESILGSVLKVIINNPGQQKVVSVHPLGG